MNRKISTAVVAAFVGGIASGASASIMTGTTYQVDQASSIDISFVSQSAGWTGSLYFTGYELGGIMHSADDTDEYGLGRYVFDNHGTSKGHTVSLGDFEAGSTLHFSYLVYIGNKANGKIRYALSTDSPDDLIQFGTEEIAPYADSSRTTLFGIEDIVGNGSDWDYNDVKTHIIARTIPTPGTASLACFAMIVGTTRRRRA